MRAALVWWAKNNANNNHNNKGQSILEKVTSLVCKRNHVDNFYYIFTRCTRREVGHMRYIWDPIVGKKNVTEGQRLYHSKERWWFPIGCPLWPLHYL